jgi:hypothetical protein
MFERHEYHCIILGKEIGKGYTSMKGIEFLKITSIMSSESRCFAIMAIDDDAAKYSRSLDEKEMGLIDKIISKHDIRAIDFALELQKLFLPETESTYQNEPKQNGPKQFCAISSSISTSRQHTAKLVSEILVGTHHKYRRTEIDPELFRDEPFM